MIKVFSYDGKEVEEPDFNDIEKTSLSKKTKNQWVVLKNASHEEISKLKEKFDIHPTIIEDLFSPQTRIKYEEHVDYTVIIFRAIKKVHSVYVKTQVISMVFGESTLITVINGENDTIDNLMKNKVRLESLLKKGKDFICHYIMDKEIDKYIDTKNILGEDFKKLEKEFLKKPGKEVLGRLFTKELVLLELRQLVESTTDLCLSLIKPIDNYISNELIPYFKDVYDHAFKTTESLKTILGRINGMRNSYQSIVSNKMNETMRVLTIIMAIMMPMTIITGFYGMNVQLPMQENDWMFAIIILLLVVISITMYFMSRKIGWIKRDKDFSMNES